MTTRIRWNAAEQALAIAGAAEKMLQYPSLDSFQALRNGQHLLRPERRKAEIRSRADVAHLLPRIDALYAQKLRNPQPAPKPVETSAATTIAPGAPERNGDPTAGLVEALDRIADAIADRIIARLVAEGLLQRVAGTPVDLSGAWGESKVATPEYDRAQATANARMRNQLAEATTREGVRLPRILIVGLLPKQADEVERAWGNQFDLTFKTSEEARVSMPLRPRTILMTKFISHTIQDRLQNMETEIMYCNGGITHLGHMLGYLTLGSMKVRMGD